MELVRGHLLTGASADTLLEGLGELARAIYVRPDWFALAGCRLEENRHINWFPGKGEPVEPALAVCRDCAARWPCKEGAIERGEHGVWGATTAPERRRLRAERDAEVA